MNPTLATFLLSAALAPRPDGLSGAGADGGPSLRWVERAGRTVVEVGPLSADRLDALRRLPPDDPRWSDVLIVRVARPPGEPQAGPLFGRYEVHDDLIRFIPRYALRGGMQYLAQFHAKSSDTLIRKGFSLESAYSCPEPAAGPPSRVVAVYPTADIVPENQLKLYLHFSAPMARGEAYRRVRVLDSAGRPVERPFLEIGEELWDPDGRRLTLLFDPGRIKRGLVPREEEGPILVEGHSYTFLIDAAWPDASGRPLSAGFRKGFRAGPPDATQPDPSRWTVGPTRPGTREPLVVRFPEPLDHAMLGRAIAVEAGGAAVAGKAEVGAEETSWRFVPDAPWPEASVVLRVDSELEDLAGNSVARPFEVDLVGGPPAHVPPRVTVAVPRAR